MNLLKEFDDIQVQHVPRAYNEEANNLAHIGLGTRIETDVNENKIGRASCRERVFRAV